MNKVLIIVGFHDKVLQDVNDFKKIYDEKCDYLAVGLDVVESIQFPWLYVATYHKHDVQKIRSILDRINPVYKLISYEQHPGVDILEPYIMPSGSSALLGTTTAMKLGYQKIVLCGCPLEGVNNRNDSYLQFQKGWTARLNEVKHYVRSMSGWTSELLKAPTKEWVDL